MSNFLKKGLILVLMTMVVLPTVALLNGAPHSGSNGLPWTTNYNEALVKSKAEGKPILLFFTGSDWCTWCHRLESEVFETSSFIDSAKDKYIFVEVDFPKMSPISPDLKAQNKQLQDKHGIRGYPTVVVVDGNGQKLGQIGYEAGGGQTYANLLDKLVAPHLAKFAKAQPTQEKVAVEANSSQL